MYMNTIYQKLVAAGFDVNQSGDFSFDILSGMTLTITRAENLCDYFMKIKPVRGYLLVTAHITSLNVFESEKLPNYSMSTHDNLHFNFNDNIDFDTACSELEQINVARQTALELLNAFKSIELELTVACEKATTALRIKEAEASKRQEENRVARTETHMDGKVKRGEYLAKKIMSEMEDETTSTQNRLSKSFVLLVTTGYSKTKTFSTVWEKGRLSWKDARNNLVDPLEVLRQISAQWVPDNASQEKT